MIDVLAIGETSKSDEEGKIVVALKIGVTGRKQTLARAALGGKQVEVYRQNGELIDVGIVRGTSQKKRTKDEDDEIDGSAKIVGGRQFQKCVGVLVKIEEAKVQPGERQPRLADVPAPVKSGDPTCKDCGHPWSVGKNPKRDKDGHGRKSGECYVVGCRCGAFMPYLAPEQK